MLFSEEAGPQTVSFPARTRHPFTPCYFYRIPYTPQRGLGCQLLPSVLFTNILLAA